MKNNKLYKGLIVAMAMIFSFSCSDDFLQEQPLSFLSPENTFIDASGLNTALQRAHRGVFEQWNGDNEEMMFNHNMSDASVVSATDKQNAFVDLRTYANPQNTRDNDAARSRSFWEQNYRQIKNCNTVIDNIDIPEWPDGTSDEERNHLLGSAYFLRAFYYMQVTMGFGNVPLPLTVVSEAKRDFKAFHVQGIWDQMVADLEYAVQWMKPKSELAIGEAPKDAARILLAKYYMMNERFAEAEALMDDVINDGESRLFMDADIPAGKAVVSVANNNNPNTGNPLPGRDSDVTADAQNVMHENAGNQRVNNPEGIWMGVNTQFVLGSQGRSARIRAWGPNFVSTNLGVWLPGTNTIGTDTQQSPDDDEGRMMKKWGRGQGFARPTNYSQYDVWRWTDGYVDTLDYRHKDINYFEMEDVLYDNPSFNPAVESDPERSKWYLQPLTLYDPDTGDLTCFDTIRCWHGYPRYKMYAVNLESRPDRQDGGDQDIYIMRMAEVYLLRAEAKAWQMDWQGAADDLNIIRNRSNAQRLYTAADLQSLGVAAVLDERNRELFGEEYRHDELVRMSVIYAKTGQQDYLGNTYSISGDNIESSLSNNSFYYNRVMDKNSFFRDEVPWATFPTTRYTMDPMHVFWPVFQEYIVGNVGAVLNQTTGYLGSESNIQPLTHVVQPPGAPNVDPQEAVGE